MTDSRQNQLITYTILSTGVLDTTQNPPIKTDTLPMAITIDPRGSYIYVANYNSADITAYAISSTGTPSAIAGASAYATGAGPSCVIVEPALGRFVYTANFIDNTVTGFQLNPNTGRADLQPELAVPGRRTADLRCSDSARQPLDASCFGDCRQLVRFPQLRYQARPHRRAFLCYPFLFQEAR